MMRVFGALAMSTFTLGGGALTGALLPEALPKL